MSSSRISRAYGDVSITGEGLKDFDQWSGLKEFEQGGIFMVLHQPCHGQSVCAVPFEGPPHFSRLVCQAEETENIF